ncbi:MAG: hypothetical protein RL095_801 [Verrucomicrobiota bacterium]|jgi:hypothetical protein
MTRPAPLVLLLALLLGAGCQSQSPLETVETGFYAASSDASKMDEALEQSALSISLDYHQGIQVFDQTRHEWIKLSKIEDLKPLLAAVQHRSFLKVSQGKAEWDKEAEYIQRITAWCREYGFDAVVLTQDNSLGLCISKIIPTRD